MAFLIFLHTSLSESPYGSFSYVSIASSKSYLSPSNKVSKLSLSVFNLSLIHYLAILLLSKSDNESSFNTSASIIVSNPESNVLAIP